MAERDPLPDFAAILRDTDEAEFGQDPLPGWAGLSTLFGAPTAPLDGAEGWLVAGVPFDATASSRPGAAEGPRAVRQASVVFSSNLRSLGEWPMLDTRTGRTFRYRAPRIVDHGDLHVYPSDTLRTFRAVASEVRGLREKAERFLFLNGDHSATFATFAGYRAGELDRRRDARVGFINIDHHFDFGDWSVLHGGLYHGANSRRISELPGMLNEDMVFVGVGDVTRYEQYQGLLARGFHVVPAARIAREGAKAALQQVVETLKAQCTSVYVSLDIDVLDAAVAAGTGHVTMGGLQSAQLLDVYEALRPLPVGALDIAEVAPRYDPSGATPHIAARVLFEFLFRTES